MVKFLLICLLAISHGINGRPSQQVPGDLASHILIVTPQAQVHLEPALKYDSLAPATFIQHLSPLARIGAPHDETIIYVPSGAALDHSTVSQARSSPAEALPKQGAKQFDPISAQIEQAQAAIQQGATSIGPQLSEAASAAAGAASNAGSSFFPTLFPPAPAPAAPAPAAAATSQKIEFEALPTAPILVSPMAEGRRFYALTPAVSHVIDLVHSPVFVGPLSAVRARSILAEGEQPEKLEVPAAELPAIQSFESELPARQILLEKKEAELASELPKMQEESLPMDAKKEEEIISLKKEEIKFAEELPFEKLPLVKQLKKDEPLNKEFAEKEKKELPAQEDAFAERREEANEFKGKEELKPLQQEKLKPFEAKEIFLEKSDFKEVKEPKVIHEEFKKEEQQTENSQPQQFLKESIKTESIKAAEAPNYNKIDAILPEKQETQQIIAQQPQQTLRSSSGRIESSEVVPAHGQLNPEEVAQQQKSVVVPVEEAVVPVFVPQLKAV